MPRARAPTPPLKLRDFERVFQVIHGVLLNEQGDMTKTCLFFGVIGAAILRQHHGLSAMPVVGAAGYNVSHEANTVLCFADTALDGLKSSASAFHCWIETDGWAIDFQAPLFHEMCQANGLPINISRKGMQRPLNGSVKSVDELNQLDAYWYERNLSLEFQTLAAFSERPVYVDLMNICLDWYKPAPHQISAVIGIQNGRGETNGVKLSPIKLSGAW